MENKIKSFSINKIVDLSRDSLTTHHVTGIAKKDKWTNVARIHVKADEGYVFNSRPKLKHREVSIADGTNTRDFLNLVFSSATRDSDNLITDYYFDLFYRNNEGTNSLNEIKIDILYNAILKVARGKFAVKEISSIKYGNNIVNQSGGRRNLIIEGTPGSKFELTFNRKSSGFSILTADKTIGSSRLDPVVGKVPSLSATIPANSNKYNCEVKIPSTTVKSTLVQGGFSSVDKFVFDDLSGVYVGDRLYSPQIARGTVVTVQTLDPDGDKWSASTGYEVQLSSSVTLSDNKSAIFKRSDQYDINIYGVENTDGKITSVSKLSTTTPMYSIYQYLDPVLTISATSSDGDYSVPASISYTGRPGASASILRNIPDYSGGKQKNYFQINWVLDASGAGGKTFTLLKNPVFSSTDQTASDFTNSVSTENGGTKVLLSNLSLTGATTNTVTITANVTILNITHGKYIINFS